MQEAATIMGNERAVSARALIVFVAAAFLALSQMLGAAHAAVPDHVSDSCAICVAADRTGPAPVAVELARPASPAAMAGGFISAPALKAAETTKPPSRGPPSLF